MPVGGLLMGGTSYQPHLGARSEQDPAILKVNIRAGVIANALAQDARTAEMKSIENNDIKAQKLTRGIGDCLARMTHDILMRVPEYVFALTDKAGLGLVNAMSAAQHVQAIATVTSRTVRDDDGMLTLAAESLGLEPEDDLEHETSWVEVVDITDIAGTPTRDTGAGAELIRKIVDWATTIGRLVLIDPVNDDLKGYYERLGFVQIDEYGSEMVWWGGGEEAPHTAYKFEMVALQQ